MRNLFVIAAVTVVLVAGINVRGEEITGWVNSIDDESDHEADLVVLDDGRIFFLPDDINVASLAEGIRVRIAFENLNGRKIITSIALAEIDPQNPENRQQPDFRRSCRR